MGKGSATLARGLAALSCVWVMGCSGSSALTPDVVQQHATELDEQRITVRGWASIGPLVTLRRCIPDRCDCNDTESVLGLKGTNAEIGVPQVHGRGDQCHIDFSLFAPNAPAYELSGRLRVDVSGVPPRTHLFLDDVDLGASHELEDGEILENLGESELRLGPYRCTAPGFPFHISGDFVCEPLDG